GVRRPRVARTGLGDVDAAPARDQRGARERAEEVRDRDQACGDPAVGHGLILRQPPPLRRPVHSWNSRGWVRVGSRDRRVLVGKGDARTQMPTYIYECAKCGEELEAWQSFADAPLKRHSDCGGKLTKVLQPVGIVLKGPGFYRTDNRNGKSNGSRSDKSDGAEKTGSSEKGA